MALYNSKVVGTNSLLDIGNHYSAFRKSFVMVAYRGSRTKGFYKMETTKTPDMGVFVVLENTTMLIWELILYE